MISPLGLAPSGCCCSVNSTMVRANSSRMLEPHESVSPLASVPFSFVISIHMDPFSPLVGSYKRSIEWGRVDLPVCAAMDNE
jgi:hypothetical protein